MVEEKMESKEKIENALGDEILYPGPENPFIVESCIFCEIIQNKHKLIYEDELVVAFVDKTPAAAAHFQVIPKEHFEFILSLNISHIPLIQYMYNIGLQLLEKNKNKGEKRFGFHTDERTVNHLHLHCFILPFTNHWFGKVKYGSMLTSVDAAILLIKEKAETERLGLHYGTD